MIVKQYQYSLEATNAYLIVENGHAILIDVPSTKIIEEIQKAGHHLDYVILTHEHVDHLWGLNELRKTFPCNVIAHQMCSKNITDARKNKARQYHIYYALKFQNDVGCEHDTTFQCDSADIVFDEQYHLVWNDISFQMTYAPGHSEGSILIQLDNQCLFSGDTILQNQDTFTDFENGNTYDYQQYTRPYIDALNKNMIVYPGHGDSFKLNKWKNGGKEK